MKRLLSILCLAILTVTMFHMSPAGAATEAGKNFAAVANREVGKKGSAYNFADDEWCGRFVKYSADEAGIAGSLPSDKGTYSTAPLMARWFWINGSRFALTRRNSSGVIECWASTSCMWNSNKPTPNYEFTPDIGDIAFVETNDSAYD